MRVFFAVEFDEETKKYIKDIQNIIRENSDKGNFSHEENFHLTVRFIGEVEQSEIDKLKTSLDEAVKHIKPFSFKFTKPGFFSRGNKKIMWIGTKNEDGMLNRLYNSLEYALSNNEYEKEDRQYNPHITLSRETILKDGFENELKRIDVKPLEVKVNSISLMESTRINGKLTYRPIYIKEI